jgi:hypothetical protein
VVD